MINIYLIFLILILLLYYLYNSKSEHFKVTTSSDLCNDCDACDYEDENSCCYEKNIQIPKLPNNQIFSSKQEAQKILFKNKEQYRCYSFIENKDGTNIKKNFQSPCQYQNKPGVTEIKNCDKQHSEIYILDYSKQYNIDGQYDGNPDNNGILYLNGLKSDYIFNPELSETNEQICSFSYFKNNNELPDTNTYFATDILGVGDDVGENNNKQVMPFDWGYGTHLEIECDLDDPQCNTEDVESEENEHFRRRIVLKIIKKIIENYNTELNNTKSRITSENSDLNTFLDDKKCNSYNLYNNEQINPGFGIEPNIFKDYDIVAKYDSEKVYEQDASDYCQIINMLNNNENLYVIEQGSVQSCRDHLINWDKNINTKDKYINVEDHNITNQLLKQIYDDKLYKDYLTQAINSDSDSDLQKCKNLYSELPQVIEQKKIVFYKKNNDKWSISFFGENCNDSICPNTPQHLRGKYDYLYILLDLDREKLMNAFEASSSSNIIKLDDYMFLPYENIKNLKSSDIQDNITDVNFEWLNLFFKSESESLILNEIRLDGTFLKENQININNWDSNIFPGGFDKQREAIQNYLKSIAKVYETINYKIINKIINKFKNKQERTNIGDYFNENGGYVNIIKTISGIIININENDPQIKLDELNEDEQTTITTDVLKNKFTKLIRGVRIDNTEQFVKNLIYKDYKRWENEQDLYFSKYRLNDDRINELPNGSFESASDSLETKGKWGYKLANQPGKELFFNKEDINKCLKKCSENENCDLVKYDKPTKSCLFYKSQRQKYINKKYYKVTDPIKNTNVMLKDTNILANFKNINYIVFNKFYEAKNDSAIKCNEYLKSSFKSEQEKIKACNNDYNCNYIPEMTHDKQITDAKCAVSNMNNNEHYFHKKNKCHKEKQYIGGCTDINSCLHYSNINDIFNDSVVEHPTYSSTGTGAGAAATTGAVSQNNTSAVSQNNTSAVSQETCDTNSLDDFKSYCDYYSNNPTFVQAQVCGQQCAEEGICYSNFSSNKCSTPLETTAATAPAAPTNAPTTTAGRTTTAAPTTTAGRTTSAAPTCSTNDKEYCDHYETAYGCSNCDGTGKGSCWDVSVEIRNKCIKVCGSCS